MIICVEDTDICDETFFNKLILCFEMKKMGLSTVLAIVLNILLSNCNMSNTKYVVRLERLRYSNNYTPYCSDSTNVRIRTDGFFFNVKDDTIITRRSFFLSDKGLANDLNYYGAYKIEGDSIICQVYALYRGNYGNCFLQDWSANEWKGKIINSDSIMFTKFRRRLGYTSDLSDTVWMEANLLYKFFQMPVSKHYEWPILKEKWFWENKGEWKAWKREQKRQRKEARKREREQRKGAAR